MTTIKKLHPTLKKCACGFAGSKTKFWQHYDLELSRAESATLFFKDHGEVPLNQDPHIEDVW